MRTVTRHGRDRRWSSALLVLACLLGGGCTADTDEPVDDVVSAAPTPTPTPTPTPSPTTPPPTPVTGTVEVTTADTSHNERLGLAEDGDPAAGSVEAAASAVAASLDAWLDGAQADDPDLGVLGAAWLPATDPSAAEVLRSGVTSTDEPVRAATYRLVVHLEPDPTVVAADVTVERRDGTSVDVELVFDVTGGAPALLVASAAGTA